MTVLLNVSFCFIVLFYVFLSNFFAATVKYKMVVTGTTFNSHLQVLTQIKNLAPDLNLVQVEEGESSEDFQIVIVFCPIVSRPGTDIEAAMKTVTGK